MHGEMVPGMSEQFSGDHTVVRSVERQSIRRGGPQREPSWKCEPEEESKSRGLVLVLLR